MSIREYGETRREIFVYLMISTLITISESRNIQVQDGLHPPANNAATNLMSGLKAKLNNFLSSTKEIYKSDENPNADKRAEKRSSDFYETTKNIPNDEFYQYKHHATPHPTLQDNGLQNDYVDYDTDKQETGNESKMRVKIDDGIEWKTEKSRGEDVEQEKSEKEVWIPDCDIPPYPDMPRKTLTNFPEDDNDDDDNEDRENDLDKKDNYSNNETMKVESRIGNSDSVYKQKLEDKVIEELLDGSSGDMTSENIERTEVGDNVNGETAPKNSENDFLKNLKDLKASLGKTLNNEAPQQSNLKNIIGELSKVLENRFGEVEKMHEKLRVRDLYGRDKVKKIQDYHRKSAGSSDDKENAILEVKKARKRLKLITKNNEEDLLPDYIEVIQELISMLKETKYVVKGVKNIEKGEKSGDDNQELSNRMTGSNISNDWKDIDTLELDYVEDVQEKDEDFKDNLSNNLRKQVKSMDDAWELEESETDSEEDYEEWMMRKQKMKKEKRKKKKEKKKLIKFGSNFGRKVPEDL